MALPRTQALLQDAIADLPEELAHEVLGFVLFVQARRAEEAKLCQAVEATQRYRADLPDQAQTVSADEWNRLTAHLDDEAP